MATQEAGTRAVTPEGSSNLPNTSYAFLPSQACSGSIMHAFFPEPAGLQLICKAQRGWSTKHRCSARARRTLWDHQGVASLARARVEMESVCVTNMQLQYIACNYTYKQGSKYGTLWTCPEGSVYSAVFPARISMAARPYSIHNHRRFSLGENHARRGEWGLH